MPKAQFLKSRSRLTHQPAVGRFQSPYRGQRGGTIAARLGLPKPIIYPWMLKGRKKTHKRRRRRKGTSH